VWLKNRTASVCKSLSGRNPSRGMKTPCRLIVRHHRVIAFTDQAVGRDRSCPKEDREHAGTHDLLRIGNLGAHQLAMRVRTEGGPKCVFLHPCRPVPTGDRVKCRSVHAPCPASAQGGNWRSAKPLRRKHLGSYALIQEACRARRFQGPGLTRHRPPHGSALRCSNGFSRV